MNKNIFRLSSITVSLLCLVYLPAAVALVGESVAARVGDTVITEANILQIMDDAASKTQGNKQTVLDGLVKRSLFAQQAIAEKLDQDPAVFAAIESSKNQILAQAYATKLAGNVHKPSSDEVTSYYNANAELFSQRAIYTVQEITVAGTADQLQAAAEQYKKIKSFNDMVEWLNRNETPYTLSATVKGSEEIPADFLKTLITLELGQVVKITTTSGLSILQLTEKRSDPKNLEQSMLAIERFLQNQGLAQQLSTAVKTIEKRMGVIYTPPYQKNNSQ
jgi:EpsD family peptidyl-prolyl cis-trans isomerase